MSNIFKYLKDHWRIVALTAGGAFLVISTGSFLILANLRSKSMALAPAPGANANANVNAPGAAPAPRTYAGLYAVSIDNQVDARPASGINQAAFVYEAPVEGGITRFLAFFERGVQAPKIGPVRSARMYFLDWVADWGAGAFFHFGGSPEASARIAATPSLGAVDEDGTLSGGKFFQRDAQRLAPHNAYTSSSDAEKALPANGSTAAWFMADDPDISARGTDGGKVMPALSNDSTYDPVWIYSSATNIYTRTIKGQVEKDADGAPVTAKNVVIMSADVSVIDADGRLKIGTAGSGNAVIYRNGQSEDVTWNESADNSGPPSFSTVKGAAAVLTAGNVWIEVVRK
jgi:hypothetical protein